MLVFSCHSSYGIDVNICVNKILCLKLPVNFGTRKNQQIPTLSVNFGFLIFTALSPENLKLKGAWWPSGI